MATDLKFGQPLDTSRPTKLVFGAGTGLPPTDAVGTMAVTVRRPGMTASATYDNAVQRGPRLQSTSSWQVGQAAGHQIAAPWQPPATVTRTESLSWGAALHTPKPFTAAYGQNPLLTRADALPWRLASPVPLQRSGQWQDMTRVDRSRFLPHQDGQIARRDAASGWNERSRAIRPDLLARWQDAGRMARELIARHQRGTARLIGDQLPWGEARKPPPGKSTTTPITPPITRCYIPPHGHSVTLRFVDRWLPTTLLRFRCREFDLPPAFFVPYQRTYMTVHSIEAVRLPDGLPLKLSTATISTDADSFCWSFQASGPTGLLQQLASVGGQLTQIQITINGTAWIFAVEKLQRTRSFGMTRVQISGRSVTALLASPYEPEQTFLSTSTMTAAQIVDQALGFSGITASWGVDDWSVPSGAWNFRGTPLAAALRVAESIKAVVQSHKTLPQLLIKPRYPLLPWEWSSPAAAADVQMPLASIITDGDERRDQPTYNRAIITGQTQGVLGIVTRTGTAGDVAIPMITEQLATDQPAILQRGRAELGAAGPQAYITQSLPVLTGGATPGVLDVNQLLEVVEPTETWRGMVRSVSITAGMPTVRQSVVVERHYA